MNKTLFRSVERRLAAAVLGITLAAWAGVSAAQPEQDADLYDGVWVVKIESLPAGYTAARLTVSNYGGSWLDTTAARSVTAKGCAGKKFPITVQRSVSTAMEFMVWGSSVSPACPDLRVELQPEGDKTLVGSIGDGGKVRLVKARGKR